MRSFEPTPHPNLQGEAHRSRLSLSSSLFRAFYLFNLFFEFFSLFKELLFKAPRRA